QRLAGIRRIGFRYQTRNSLAAQIHERLRLREFHSLTFNHRAPHQRTAFASLNARARVFGQLINQHESEVVTRPLVFVAGIAESNNQAHKGKSKKVKKQKAPWL